MTIHKDIRIEFEFKCTLAHLDEETNKKIIGVEFKEMRRYEVIGFLNNAETYVSGKEMLSRAAAENGGAIGEDDEQFLYDNNSLYNDCDWTYIQHQIPPELEPYWLVTGKYNSGRPTFISCFNRFERRRWVWLGIDFDAKFLVLRRLPLTQT